VTPFWQLDSRTPCMIWVEFCTSSQILQLSFRMRAAGTDIAFYLVSYAAVICLVTQHCVTRSRNVAWRDKEQLRRRLPFIRRLKNILCGSCGNPKRCLLYLTRRMSSFHKHLPVSLKELQTLHSWRLKAQEANIYSLSLQEKRQRYLLILIHF